jgi:hypothetical protein
MPKLTKDEIPTRAKWIDLLLAERDKMTVGAVNFLYLYCLSLKYGTPVIAAFYGYFAGLCGAITISLNHVIKYAKAQ